MTWQPIESAPMDGTLVLLFWQRFVPNGNDGWAVGKFEDGRWTDDEGECGWRQPTHWQPLPAPPPLKDDRNG